MPSHEIQTLLLRVADGEASALAELYDATAVFVFGILRRMLWNTESAEEVAQEVYIQVWRTARGYDPGRGSAWSWLALLTRGRAIGRMRADGSYRDAIADLVLHQPFPDPIEPVSPPRSDVVGLERAGAVREALRTLPGDQRRALELAFFGGLTQREIAYRIDTPLPAVKGRIRTALTRLRERLAPVPGP
ncbi:MAG TPA: sigma-70 family RNA polymerase sigma factor [Gemmatimonadota bacterium]|nr:sigma-70 family RNA polymerase sigma factor [Gemmatimonadota bacterium]